MSYKASNWARVQILHSTPKAILMYLADRANESEDYSCWPTQGLIAEETGFSPRTVWSVLAYLTEIGLLVREHRSGAPRAGEARRRSDKIFLQVSSDRMNIATTYREWLKARTPVKPDASEEVDNSQLSQPWLATVANLVSQLLREREPKEEPKEEPSALHSLEHSSLQENESALESVPERSAEDARARGDITPEVEAFLVETTLTQAKQLLIASDEFVLGRYELVQNLEELPFRERPAIYRANLAYVEVLYQEMSKRFSGVS